MLRKKAPILVVFAVAAIISVTLSTTIAAQSEEGLDAAMVGLSEFTPGSTGVVQISVQNNNVIEKIDPAAGQAGMSQYYGSAVSLTVHLEEGNAPITVKTEKALLGTLPAGMATDPISFVVDVDEEANAGTYQVELLLTYKTLLSTSFEAGGGTEFEWSDNKTESKNLDIEIKEEEEKVSLEEEGVDAAIVGLNEYAPGSTAVVQISVQNNNIIEKIDAAAGQAEMSQYYGSAVSLTARLERGNGPVTVKTEKVQLGTLPVGVATDPIPFAIEVDEDARPGKYLLRLLLTYRTLLSTSSEDGGAELEWSDSKTESKNLKIEIKEESTPEFEFTSIKADLRPGARSQIEVAFKNRGNETAWDATAKVSANAPISLTDNTAFLGTLEPGEIAVGKFGLKVAGGAISKEYALDAFIKYTDDDGEEQQSERLKLPIEVGSATPLPTAIADAISNNLVAWLVGAAVVAIVWLIWSRIARARRKGHG